MVESVPAIHRLLDFAPSENRPSPEWNIAVPPADHLSMLTQAISSTILPLLNSPGLYHLRPEGLSLNDVERALAARIAQGDHVSVLAILDLDGSLLPHPLHPTSLSDLERGYREGYRCIRGIAKAADLSCIHTGRISVDSGNLHIGLPHWLAKKFPFVDQVQAKKIARLGDFEEDATIDHKLIVISDKLTNSPDQVFDVVWQKLRTTPDIIYSIGDTVQDGLQAGYFRQRSGIPTKHISMGDKPRKF